MFKHFMIAGLGAAALFTGSAMADPTSYQLTCRGGGDMRFHAVHDVDSEGRSGAVQYRIFFDPAPQRATSGALPLGSCAWQDRPLNDAEPTVLWWKTSDVELNVSVTPDGRIFADTRGYRLNAEGLSEFAQDLNYALVHFFAGTTFDVMAYNADGRVMVVTDVLR